MFLNINGTVQKQLKEVNNKKYKVANQALYPSDASSEVIYQLEICRKYNIRVILNEKIKGYIRHVIINEYKYPMLFFRSNSKKYTHLPFPINKIQQSNTKRVIYTR